MASDIYVTGKHRLTQTPNHIGERTMAHNDTTFAFKPQAKHNAKRFLVKTCKIAPEQVDQYLTQVDGEWGTYTTTDGTCPLPAGYANILLNTNLRAEIDAFEVPALPATDAGANVFAAMVAPVAAPAAKGNGTTVRDGKRVDAAAEADTKRSAQPVQPGDACPLCGGHHSSQTEATPGVSAYCHECGKTYSIATGREVRTGFTRENVNKGYKIQKERARQNGVTRPSAGTLCGNVWDALDKLREEKGMPVSADLQALADANGWNKNNVSCEFYAWRKFNGISGRQTREGSK